MTNIDNSIQFENCLFILSEISFLYLYNECIYERAIYFN